jgi:hypothetical protein
MHDQLGGLRQAMDGLRVDVRSELSGLRADIRHELGELRTEFRSELVALRTESRGEAASLRGDLAYLRGRFDVLIWAVGINAAATVAILGVLLRH